MPYGRGEKLPVSLALPRGIGSNPMPGTGPATRSGSRTIPGPFSPNQGEPGHASEALFQAYRALPVGAYRVGFSVQDLSGQVDEEDVEVTLK